MILIQILLWLQRLEDPYDCTNCISGQSNSLEECACNKESAACLTNENDLISVQYSASENDCIIKCFSKENCTAYTWYNENNEEIQNTCILYSACDEKESCASTCQSGSIICQEEKCNDIEYYILDESDRNFAFNDGDDGIEYCDYSSSEK